MFDEAWTERKPVISRVFAETGAQMDILDWPMHKALGIDELELLPVSCRINSAVRGSRINVRGGVLEHVLPGV